MRSFSRPYDRAVGHRRPATLRGEWLGPRFRPSRIGSMDQRHCRKVPAQRSAPRGACSIEFTDIRNVRREHHQVTGLAASSLKDRHEIAKRHPPLSSAIGPQGDLGLSRLSADLARDAHASFPAGDNGVRKSSRARPALRQDLCVGAHATLQVPNVDGVQYQKVPPTLDRQVTLAVILGTCWKRRRSQIDLHFVEARNHLSLFE